MSSDVYTETSTEGWFSRLGKSFMGVLVGFLLFVLSFVVLWWNEGNLVHTEAGYAEGKDAMVEVDSAKLDDSANGKLVHLSGHATTDETLVDSAFGVSAQAIKLLRNVQMYQWEEEKETKKEKQLGGGEKTVTTYNYKKTWASRAIDSSSFKRPDGHQNPPSLPFDSTEQVAKKTTLGAYTLSPSLVDQINSTEKLSVPQAAAAPSLDQPDPNAGTPNLEKPDPNAGTPIPDAPADPAAPAEAAAPVEAAAPAAPVAIPDGFKAEGGLYYRGDNPNSPQIGDVKVAFEVVKPTDVSVLARQNGNTFEGWTSSNGTTINKLMLGTQSKDAMFQQLASELSMLTWILRFVGFIMMFAGLSAIAGPLGVLADVIPFLGDLVRMGTGLFAGVIAAALSLTTIAIAWLFYRPLYGIGLIAIAVLLVVVARMLFAPKRPMPTQFSPEGA